MVKKLDELLADLAKVEKKINKDTKLRDKLRDTIFLIMEKEEANQYKSDVATISYNKKKVVKYTEDPKDILLKVSDLGIAKYIKIIPEKKELSKDFENDVKEGKVEVEGVELEEGVTKSIRFNN